MLFQNEKLTENSVAGSETTASSLSSMVNQLLRNPRVYKNLTDEIRRTFKNESEIGLGRCMNELPYLTACIEENLRVFPPAPIGFLRSVNRGGDVIDGHAIPGDVSVKGLIGSEYMLIRNRLLFQ
jgi:cytochrome P450